MQTPFIVEHIKESNYVRVRPLVSITREIAADFAAQAEDECIRVGSPGYLVDARGVCNDSSVSDNYEYSAWDLKKVEDRVRFKHAVLTDTNDDSHDLPILAMQEMGFNVKKFTDEQEAVAWLTAPG